MKKICVLMLLIMGGLLSIGQTYSVQKKITPQERLNEQYCSGLFKLADGIILEVNDNQTAQNYLNILDWLDGRVAGLRIYSSWSGVKLPVIRGSQAKIYVDEMAVDASYLNSLPVSDIGIIKVIKGPAASIFGASGVIAIYTINDEDEEDD